MRPAFLTLLPMLAAAAIAVIGGERLAQREVEERTPADRDRLLQLSQLLEEELERLDTLYIEHLQRASLPIGIPSAEEGEIIPVDPLENARAIPSLLALSFFTSEEEEKGTISLLPVGSRVRLPEVVLEGRKRPLDPRNATTLSPSLLDPQWLHHHGWTAAPKPQHRIFWYRPDARRLVTGVIDWNALHHQLTDHLAAWLPAPLTPLREAGEKMQILSPEGQSLASIGDDQRGPAALLLPIRTSLGDWQIQAWDGVVVRQEHDTATLAIAGILACILTLTGLILFIQQRRALQLAEERVSFVNRVSHELGTPLTNVALNLDLATEATEINPAETQKRLGIVTEEIERLARLVANVLTFSRRERRTLELRPQPCVPDEVIEKTIASFRPSLRRHQIEVEWQAAAERCVRLDPDALGQIVGNLVSNIEKYATEGRWLGIESRLEDDWLTIEIADAGSGIPAANRQRIFQPFERVHRKVNEGSSGTGLGLTIARELADRMGGSLELLDCEKGTRFHLRLPAPENLSLVSDDQTSAA